VRDIIKDISLIDDFVLAFQNKTLPKSEWTHEAHFVTALWHLLKYGFDNATERMRSGIVAYNESVGGRNTDTDGYHETITLFYMDVLADFAERHAHLTETDLYRRLLDDELMDRSFPMNFYSKDVLFSVRARRNWVPPDLRTPAFIRLR